MFFKFVKISLSILFFLLNNLGICQVSQEWAVRYNGIGNSSDEALAITTDVSGNIYITGQSMIVTGTGNNDFLTIKYTSSGIQQWVARYNGSANDNDYAQAIVVDDSGNVFVTGSSQGNSTFFDYATVKYNSSGIQQWVARYNGIENRSDQSRAIAIDDFGNVFVTGESYSSVTRSNCVTIKYSSSGDQQWIASYNNLNNGDGGFVLKTDKQGNVYVGGYTGNIGSQEDFLTIKYSSAGIQEWAAIYDGITHQTDQIKYMVLDISGNVYVTGSSAGTSNYADYAIIKYDSAGLQQWVQRYNGTADYYDRPCGIGIDKSGNIYVGGYSSENSTGYDFTAIKYNKNGEQKWISHYNNVLNDFARSMTLDSLGNVYIIGDVIRSSTGSDYATVKFDSNGVQKWAMIYSTAGDSNDIPNAVAVDNSGSVYVAGYVNQQHPDCMTIKYSQLTGPTINESNVPAEYTLSQNYPNPFNPTTKIKFDITRDVRREMQDVKLVVYDVLGSEVVTLINESKAVGSYEVEFDATGFPSGIYFYSLLIDGNVN